MTRILLMALLLLIAASPVFAQKAQYAIDNFDMRNGVSVQNEPPKPQPGNVKRRSTKSLTRTPRPSDSIAVTNLAPSTTLQPTVLFTNLTSNVPSGDVSALRGYTTGSSQVDGYLIDSGKKNGVDPLLLYSVMHQESSFKANAVSPKGARGLMQLMPGTAVRYGVNNIFDPKQNIEGGARYLRFLLDRFDGDLNLVLAGYNAGEGAVEKFGWQIPPYSETREYVRRISRRYALLRDPNAALYAPRLSGAQLARLQSKQPTPLAIYERTISTVRLPDGRLQLMSQ
jgi:soluble lytic murein transglycosylase-like protein